ncbi:hypothetical protein BDZ94DRAFT_1261476 [Collybia nuda]|uniref:Uncharacterized protein n=1 Tax=Collybia nuda TaxID=64659 RepID=A0A9P6CDY5_9AGAR|nr:hypothetical protein BDZ94DRAFT_1261476 [Collybia nuda]
MNLKYIGHVSPRLMRDKGLDFGQSQVTVTRDQCRIDQHDTVHCVWVSPFTITKFRSR